MTIDNNVLTSLAFNSNAATNLAFNCNVLTNRALNCSAKALGGLTPSQLRIKEFFMERVALFIDFYNFVNSSNEYLNQKSYIDYTQFHEHFIDASTQTFVKSYFYGGLNYGKMLDFLGRQERIDVIRGEVGQDGKEKCTDINIAMGMLIKAFHNAYDVGVLFSGDRDYTKLVRELKRMGKVVGIATPDGDPKRKAQQLSRNCDFHIALREDFYAKYWKAPDGSVYVSKMSGIDIPNSTPLAPKSSGSVDGTKPSEKVSLSVEKTEKVATKESDKTPIK